MADISQLELNNEIYNFKDTEGRTQVLTMPDASADLLGKILQFVGTTTSSYTNGYFYKCVRDTQPNTYYWEYIDTSDMSSKENKIMQTSKLTLTAADWDSDNMQTVRIYPTYLFPIENRHIIDITYSELQTWADNGVVLYSEMGVSVSGKDYLDRITFKCESVPNTDLTFRLTSMEVS